MTVKEFAANLAASLMDEGISKEDAVNHVLTLSKTLSEDDLREIAEYKSAEDFSDLSQSLAEIIKKKNTAKKRADARAKATEDLLKTKTVSVVTPLPGATRTFDVSSHTAAEEEPVAAPTQEIEVGVKADEPQEIILGDDSYIKEKTIMTTRGKVIFWLISILTLPLSMTAAALIGVLFALSVCAVCGFIAVTFVLVLAEIAAGGSGFFVGFIYGIVKIFGGTPGTGLYEMGIGVACLGVTVILSFLTYSFAAKTLPYLLKELLAFWGIAVRRIALLIEHFREECNKL